MMTGNLAPVRDYLHVSDVVAAYISMLERGTPGQSYNVASGRGYSVLEVVNHVLARIGLDASIVEDPALVRAVDVPVLVGDATRLTSETGWRPLRRFDDILTRDLVSLASMPRRSDLHRILVIAPGRS